MYVYVYVCIYVYIYIYVYMRICRYRNKAKRAYLYYLLGATSSIKTPKGPIKRLQIRTCDLTGAGSLGPKSGVTPACSCSLIFRA